MNFKTILVITYGRSGSTLLQGVLNSIDGCLIRGENSNFCYNLFEAYRTLLGSKQHQKSNVPLGSDNSLSAYFGATEFNEDTFISDLRRAATTHLLGDQADNPQIKCIGFKEIRYLGRVPLDDLNEYLCFLERLFPNTAFILNTRNHDDVLKSGWWKKQDTDRPRKKLPLFEKEVLRFFDGRTNCFHIRYSDVCSRSENLEKLFEFLGAEYDSAKIGAVLGKPHSYEPTQGHVKKIFSSKPE